MYLTNCGISIEGHFRGIISIKCSNQVILFEMKKPPRLRYIAYVKGVFHLEPGVLYPSPSVSGIFKQVEVSHKMNP